VSSRRTFLKSVSAAAIAAGGAACAPRAKGVASGTPAPGAAPSTTAPAAAPGPIRLGSNENSFGPGPAARRAIAEAASEANRYPFRIVPDLTAAVAATHGISASQVLLGSGSGELLNAVVTAFTTPERGLVTAAPTFEMPLDRVGELGRQGVAVRVDASGRLDLDAMLAASANAGLVYVCNPNNPTATVHGGADVEAFIEAVHRRNADAMVLVDEAYHEFVALPAYRTMLPRATSDPRVIVTRTFSKIHGMAGLRVGFAVGAPSTLARLRVSIDPMNMNGIGLAAARASIDDQAYVAEKRAVNEVERSKLRAALTGAGYSSFDSDANFLMVHVRRDPRRFAAACHARGVQVARPFPPLLEHARITIGTPDEMARATGVFLEVLATRDVPRTARAAWPDAPRGC
jgi:histidinol-phosphate aminotransferase